MLVIKIYLISSLYLIDFFCFQSLVAVHFTRDNYLDLLNRYARRSDHDSMRQVACEWMRNNTDVWKKWLPDGGEENVLHIGGIFPFSVKEYRPKGIVVGKLLIFILNNFCNLRLISSCRKIIICVNFFAVISLVTNLIQLSKYFCFELMPSSQHTQRTLHPQSIWSMYSSLFSLCLKLFFTMANMLSSYRVLIIHPLYRHDILIIEFPLLQGVPLLHCRFFHLYFYLHLPTTPNFQSLWCLSLSSLEILLSRFCSHKSLYPTCMYFQ